MFFCTGPILGLGVFVGAFSILAVNVSPGAAGEPSPVPTRTATASPPAEPTVIQPSANPPNWADETVAVAAVVSAVAAVVALAAVVIGGWLAYRQLRLARAASYIDTLGFLGTRWDSDRLVRARQFVNKFESPLEVARAIERADVQNLDAYYDVASLLGFFEELGLLCCQADNDPSGNVFEYVKGVYSGPVTRYYPLLACYIQRKAGTESGFVGDFARLFEKIDGVLEADDPCSDTIRPDAV